MRLIWIGWLCCVISCVISFGQPKPSAAPKTVMPQVELIQPGSFRKGEVRAMTSGGWLALAPIRDGFTWRRVRIVVSDGTKVEVVDGDQEAPLFLLRGLPLLGTKAVHTCFDRSEAGSLFVQNPILLTCEAQAYRVEVTSVGRAVASELRFSHAGRVQTLFRWPDGLIDQRAELIWAGDLDGDGRVDLLVDCGEKNSVSRLSLYLSTWAGAGQLVGRAGSFVTRIEN